MSSPDDAAPRLHRRSLAVAAALAACATAVVAGVRSCRDEVAVSSGARARATVKKAVLRPDPVAPPRWDAPVEPGPPGPPSVGWEGEADILATDLAHVLEGRPSPGAFAEARAEAARQDLALFPPDEDRVRRMLLGDDRERTLALAALAARPPSGDDIVSLVVASRRPDDGDLLRLLGAEIWAALAPELVSRHEDELLHVFEREPNPLVLAFALPALERMREDRLRELMRAQVAAAEPEMLPVLLALARDRLGSEAMESVEEGLRATLQAGGAAGGSP